MFKKPDKTLLALTDDELATVTAALDTMYGIGVKSSGQPPETDTYVKLLKQVLRKCGEAVGEPDVFMPKHK